MQRFLISLTTLLSWGLTSLISGEELSEAERERLRREYRTEDIPLAYQVSEPPVDVLPIPIFPLISFVFEKNIVRKYEHPNSIVPETIEPENNPILIPTEEEIKQDILDGFSVLIEFGDVEGALGQIVLLNEWTINDLESQWIRDSLAPVMAEDLNTKEASIVYHYGLEIDDDLIAAQLIAKANDAVENLFASGKNDGDAYMLRAEIRFDHGDDRNALMDYRRGFYMGVSDWLWTDALRAKLSGAMYRYGGTEAYDASLERSYSKGAELYEELLDDLNDNDRTAEIDEKFALMTYRRALDSIRNDDRQAAAEDVLRVHDLRWNADIFETNERLNLIRFMHEEDLVSDLPVVHEWHDAFNRTAVKKGSRRYYVNFEYSAWGEWIEQDAFDPTSERPRHFFVGTRTSSEDIPRVGGAVYEGDIEGHYSSDNVHFERVNGSSTMTVDFSDRSVVGALNLRKLGQNWLLASFDTSLNPSAQHHYEGDLRGQGVLSGQIQGDLMGPQATETAAGWTVSTDNGVASGVTLASKVRTL